MPRNRFGQTRFLTKEQSCDMLTEMFTWPIEHGKPERGYCPVVVMGHSIGDDFAQLNKTLGFNAAGFDSVVKIIDTQHLSRETGYWRNMANPTGLAKLVPKCGFEYRDPHTASNDAAMTLIAAIQMVLPSSLKDKKSPGKTLQTVIDDVEKASQHQMWTWGTDKYCIRCGQHGHTKTNYRGRRCFVKVNCLHCATSRTEKRQHAAYTHRTECCITYAMRGPEVYTVADVMAAAYRAGI